MKHGHSHGVRSLSVALGDWNNFGLELATSGAESPFLLNLI